MDENLFKIDVTVIDTEDEKSSYMITLIPSKVSIDKLAEDLIEVANNLRELPFKSSIIGISINLIYRVNMPEFSNV